MTKSGISQVVFCMLAAVTVVFLGFFVALVTGAVGAGPPAPQAGDGAMVALRARTATPPVRPVAKRVRRATPIAAETPVEALAQNPTRLATVVVTAARGDCWISARLGSETGKVLEERLLAQGESVTVRGPRIWLSAGAAANVDVMVNGQQQTIRSGTVAVVLSPA